jgi:hypothetical protein
LYFRRELQVKEIPKWGRYLRGKWEEHFAAHLSSIKKKEISLHSFLWHLCSYEETEFNAGEDAVAAFHKQKKNKCLIFFELNDDAYLIEDASKLFSSDLHLGEEDIYVMDWEGQWSFMATHENGYGPYFISNK